MSEAENIVDMPNPAPLNVYQMISQVTAKLCERGGVGKDQTNEYDKYKFRGIDQIYDALAPILSSVGLVILPEMTSRDTEIKQSKNGGALNFVNLTVKYRLVSSEDGSECVVTVPGEAMDRSDKATNKALSAAYKYMCFQVFCIPLEGQDSMDKESPELGKDAAKKSTSVAKWAADDGGAPMTPQLQECIAAVNMAVFNDDAPGFYELWDELNSDEQATVAGYVEHETKKQCRAWLVERREKEKQQ